MLLYEKETGKIIKACMNVFNELGNCFLEPVYQEALSIEFDLLGIPYKKEVKLEIIYKGYTINKPYYADFVCFDSIIVELKILQSSSTTTILVANTGRLTVRLSILPLRILPLTILTCLWLRTVISTIT